MKKYTILGAILLVNANTTETFAGGNELFEAKTSTAAIKETSNKVLTSANHDQLKAMKIATQASRDALKAYRNCPPNPEKARTALIKSVRNLERQQDVLAGISTTDGSILALADFGATTIADIETLLLTDAVCDQGTNLLQSELIFNPAAPFVSFAQGWGNMQFGSHGTFGEFSAGLAAPDHVHSGTYYGVVINGILKNPFGELPTGEIASARELPAGSFWSVPANATHTTACARGANCVFYFHSRTAFDFDTDTSGGETMDADAQEISVDEIAVELAKIATMSRSVFSSKFHNMVGEPPIEYLARWRMFKAREMLLETTMPIPLISEKVGYGSEFSFSRAFKKMTGSTPGAVRKSLMV